MSELHRIGADTREWLVGPVACPELAPLRIELCGLSAARDGFAFARDAWERAQVLVCHEGAGEALVDGAWRRVDPGEAYVCARGVPHAYRCIPGSEWGVAWAIIIELDGLEPTVAPGPPRLVQADHRAFADAVRNLHREATGANQRPVRGQWAALVALLATRIAGGDDADHRLDRLWEAVDQDLTRPWTLGDLARLADLGPERLRRLCLKRVARSPVHQVTWMRMQRAATLLAARRGTVAEVALAVGYDNPFAFSTAFKRAFGRPPSAYRAE